MRSFNPRARANPCPTWLQVAMGVTAKLVSILEHERTRARPPQYGIALLDGKFQSSSTSEPVPDLPVC